MDGNSISEITNHILTVSKDVISPCIEYSKDLTLIGSAGTFEIFLPQGHLEDSNITHSIVELELIRNRYFQVLHLEASERERISWLPLVRNKYIVLALMLMQTIIEAINPQGFIVSKYSLKEGAITSDKTRLDDIFKEPLG